MVKTVIVLHLQRIVYSQVKLKFLKKTLPIVAVKGIRPGRHPKKINLKIAAKTDGTIFEFIFKQQCN